MNNSYFERDKDEYESDYSVGTIDEENEQTILMNNNVYDKYYDDNLPYIEPYSEYDSGEDDIDDAIIYYYCNKCWNPFTICPMSNTQKKCSNYMFKIFLIILCIVLSSSLIVIVLKYTILSP